MTGIMEKHKDFGQTSRLKIGVFAQLRDQRTPALRFRFVTARERGIFQFYLI